MTFFSGQFKLTPYNLASDPTALLSCNTPTIDIYADAAHTTLMTGPPPILELCGNCTEPYYY